MATTVNYLNQSRDAKKQAQDLAWQEAVRLANEQKTSTTQQAEKLASEVYVNKRQQERTLPNVLQQAGLSGTGYTETTANNINTAYQNAWNQIMTNQQSALGQIDSGLASAKNTVNQNKAGIDADYYDALASYYASLKPVTTNPDNPSNTNNDYAPDIPDYNKKTSQQILADLYSQYTSEKYRYPFFNVNYEATLNKIKTSIQALSSKLTQAEMDAIVRKIGAYWMATSDRERQNPGGRVNPNTPTMPIPTTNVNTNPNWNGNKGTRSR